MRFATVCSGIGAPETAWIPLGWECAFHSEIEAFPSAVLKHHYHDVPNYGDMTKYKEWPDHADKPVELICGGCPCQAFSVAGLRKGLDDPRGNLTLVYLGVLAKYRPRWVVYENVPGLLSDKTGAFGAFLGGLAELGYGSSYRILDAQFTRVDSHPFAVPQRRRRLFVVGYLGDWRAAAAVFLERESLLGNPAPCRKAGQRVAPTVGSGPPFSRTGNDRVEVEAMVVSGSLDSKCCAANRGCQANETDFIVPEWPATVAPTLNAAFADKQGLEDQHINGGGALFVSSGSMGIAGAGQQGRGQRHEGRAFNCGKQMKTYAVRTAQTSANGHGISSEAAHTLDGANGQCVCLMDQRGGLMQVENDITGTLRKETHGHEPVVVHTVDMQSCKGNCNVGKDVSPTLAKMHGHDIHAILETHEPGVAFGTDCFNGQITGEVAATIGTSGSSVNATGPTVAVAFAQNQLGEARTGEVTNTLSQNGNASWRNTPMVKTPFAVRRLTPVECARLQGFPDDYLSQVQFRGKCPPADGVQYKALGNSMAINCMTWIGQRIGMVDEIMQQQQGEQNV